jgi:hypothetical protein
LWAYHLLKVIKKAATVLLIFYYGEIFSLAHRWYLPCFTFKSTMQGQCVCTDTHVHTCLLFQVSAALGSSNNLPKNAEWRAIVAL